MRNLDRIRAMPVEELAPFLVKTAIEYDDDEDFEGNIVWNETEVYESPDGSRSWSYDSAVEYTIKWLNEEVANEGNN